jgi:hypothetical protein
LSQVFAQIVNPHNFKDFQMNNNFLNLVLANESNAHLKGWVENSNTDYHSGAGIGSSQLKDFLISPGLFFYNHVLGFKKKETDSLRLGKIAHYAVLEPRHFLDNYRIMPDFGDLRSSKNREAKSIWLNDQPPGVIVITEDERTLITRICESIAEHPIAVELLKDGIPEMSGYWIDQTTKILLRVRPDFRTRSKIIVDLKTCRSAKYRIFQKDCYDLNYSLSVGMYITGASIIDGVQYNDFDFIAVEKYEPIITEVFVADDEFIDYGKSQFRIALDGLAECIHAHAKLVEAGETNLAKYRAVWPHTKSASRKLQAMNLSLPAYAFYEQ